SFLSYDLSPRLLRRRDLLSRAGSPTYYELLYQGRELRFNLSINSQLLAPGFVSETRYGGISHAKIRPYTHSYACHLVGEVQDSRLEGGFAAISSCNGLKGVFQLSNEDYFIEPLDGIEPRAGVAQPHVVYKRQIPEHQEDRNQGKSEKRRERWEQKQQQQRKRRLQQRSISKDKWVETLVVADTKMVEYHGWDHVENYVLTVMNMVAGLFHDPSIGNPIHISIVRLILLEKEEEDLKITHHADNTLRSFCKWQKSINMKGDTHPLHHDVAVLLTRRDLCAAMNRPCETLGLSHVSGMCQPHRSCNVNEDTGLPLAFTVAHELGHSFGIQHDGSGNDCEPIGKKPFIMSPQLLYDTSPLTWSRCSQEYITRFLDRGWGLCLDDPPANDVIDFPIVPPGVLYDVSHQCRLQYGAYSTFCDDMDNVCNTLWCSVGTTCHSKLDAAVDGTRCGENKWCFNGECVSVGFRPDAVDGAWAGWSSWSSCSRSCGVGVQSSERQCSNPTPKYGGKYCVGERKRFRLCSIQACPADRPSFRHIQCSQFDAMPYKGEQYKWVPVSNHINPCELHCRPTNEYFAIKLRDAVVDGTPCFEGNTSRDLCINGICKNVGCDYEIDSNAIEDRCGVCHGDGSTCETVKKTFDETEGLGYVDIGLIPVGAREIRIEEVAEAANFLALRSEDPEKYFLNGGWTIQWNGDYKVAGTTFTYERNGNWENLTSPGPTWEPIWIQLLFQESNPGVRYQYTIQREADSENEIQPPEFSWRYGAWTKCTVTCGTGVQRQAVHCVEKLAGLVEERHCDALTRPDDRQKNCSQEPCPARWWSGEWQSCSRTCGPGGLALRTVLCIQSVGLDEQRALRPEDCHPMPKPEVSTSCNEDNPCPSSWEVGNWSECSVSCGTGIHSRPVSCANDTGAPCDTSQKPISETACSLPPCPWMPEKAVPEWSGSGASSRELFNEIEFTPSNHIPPFEPLAPGAPGPQDSNVIVKDDFSPNVFVDDFYYDYNFINFHEDLSNSPFEDRDKPSEEIGGGTDEGPEGWGTSDETPLAAPPSSEGEDQAGPESPTTRPIPAQEETSSLGPFLSTVPSSAPRTEVTIISKDADPIERSQKSSDHRLKDTNILPTEGTWRATSSPIPSETKPVTFFPLQTSLSSPTMSSVPGPRNADLPAQDLTQWDFQTPVVPVTSDPNDLAGPVVMPWDDHSLSSALTPSPGLDNLSNEIRVSHYPDFSSPSSHPWAPQFQSPADTEPVGTEKSPQGTLATTEVPGGASWEVGDWSECSTTCGLGAIWRSVSCSTGREEDCVPTSKPVPARRCYLRPCSTWRVGNWSKCSRNCGGGFRFRDVHCVDSRDRRLLRPFHCQPGLFKPLGQLSCHVDPCLDWYTSSWRECSEACGGGEQERLVTCPEFGRCEETVRPNTTRPCNTHPCTKWVVGPWGQCSITCGGGIQRRLVKCVNTKTGQPEEDNSLCDHEAWPENSQRCSPQDYCELLEGLVCDRDRLTFSFCETLHLLGRCRLPTVRVQCCKTCSQDSHGARDRGNERVSRR
uniref:ADAM metallopeptidase with thrombospondin type 1 motif 7 n=1 Tax=Vombatus ursinus TaxID=29139 RepID=A0A4X2L479_VOMUR